MIYTDICLEGYHGQTQNIKKAQLSLDKIYRKILSGDKFDKENKELEKYLSSEFNTKDINITWITDGGLNAYTTKTTSYIANMVEGKMADKNANIPFITSTATLNKELAKGTKKSNVNIFSSVFIFINTGLISVLDFSSREMMGVILHEIGHQINLTPYKSIEEVWDGISTMGVSLVIAPVAGNFFSRLMNTVHETIQSTFPKLTYIWHEIGTVINNYSPTDISFIRVIKNIPWLIRRLPISFLNYGEERMADAIVADYGYAPELVSSHHKFETMYEKDINKFINKIPVLNAIYSANMLLLSTVLTVVDEHPNSQTRMTQAIKRLERDLKNNVLPPQLKKELQKDLNRAKKIYENDYLSKNAKDFNYLTLLKRKLCDKLFNGNDDWREMFAPIFNKIEDR